MTHDIQVNYYIHANKWQSLEKLLKSEKGFIHSKGGRCFSHPNFLSSDLTQYSSVLSKTCWAVYQASLTKSFKELPEEERDAARNVILELRRLYTETETMLAACPTVPYLVTRTYDLLDKLFDGYTPTARLEKLVLGRLQEVNENN